MTEEFCASTARKQAAQAKDAAAKKERERRAELVRQVSDWTKELKNGKFEEDYWPDWMTQIDIAAKKGKTQVNITYSFNNNDDMAILKYNALMAVGQNFLRKKSFTTQKRCTPQPYDKDSNPFNNRTDSILTISWK